MEDISIRKLTEIRDVEDYLSFKDVKGCEIRIGLEGFKFKGFNRREYELFLKGFLGRK